MDPYVTVGRDIQADRARGAFLAARERELIESLRSPLTTYVGGVTAAEDFASWLLENASGQLPAALFDNATRWRLIDAYVVDRARRDADARAAENAADVVAAYQAAGML